MMNLIDYKNNRILFIIGSLSIGGAENHLAQVSYGLLEKGWNVEICLLAPNIEIDQKLLHKKLKIFHVPRSFAENKILKQLPLFKLILMIACSLLLLKILMTRKYSVVHMFLPQAYLVGGFLSIMARVPIKIMSRRSLNHYQKKNRLFYICEKILHKRMNMILGNSKKVIEDLRQEGVREEKIRLIYNGINIKKFKIKEKTAATCREKLGINTHDFVIIMVANLIPYKGHMDLIRAVSSIDKQINDWKLILLGNDRGIKESLVKTIKSYNLEKKVIIKEKIVNVEDFLFASDLAVLSSHEEGFSNSILEYMAAELPIVATDVGGNREAIGTEEIGLVVPSKNPIELGKAILKLHKTKLRKEMGNKARLRVASMFSLDKCVVNYEKLYFDCFLNYQSR